MRHPLSKKEGARLRAKIFLFTRKQKADSEGWIHDLALLVRKEFELRPFQASHHLDVLVDEGRLVRKTKGSSLYRVTNGGKVKRGPSRRSRKQEGPTESNPPTSRRGKAGILAKVASQPGFQKWLEAEITEIEANLEALKALRR